MLYSLLPILAISNLSEGVIDNLGQYFGDFIPDFFGSDSSGYSLLFGLVLVVLFLGICFFLHLSLDAIIVVMFPLVLLLTAYGVFPPSIGILALIIGGAVVYLGVSQWLRR